VVILVNICFLFLSFFFVVVVFVVFFCSFGEIFSRSFSFRDRSVRDLKWGFREIQDREGLRFWVDKS